jgi:viroplasmin and RNaseH domain-containing protein
MDRASTVYAVCTGRVPGIYTEWEMCFRTIEEYPLGKFSTFRTMEEAILFMKTNGHRKITLYTEKKHFILVNDTDPLPLNTAEGLEIERIHRQRAERQLRDTREELAIVRSEVN